MAELVEQGDGVWTVQDLLSEEECRQWIERTEAMGYGDAPVTTPAGPVMAKEVRNNDRVMFDDAEVAGALWERLEPFVPRRHPRLIGDAVGLNERFRFYRYQPGQRFAWHRDGYFARPDGSETSRLTFMVYLNDGFVGGRTELTTDRDVVIEPRTGTALLFLHGLLHQGAAVTEGRKYVLRSDVMYGLSRSRGRGPDASS